MPNYERVIISDESGDVGVLAPPGSRLEPDGLHLDGVVLRVRHVYLAPDEEAGGAGLTATEYPVTVGEAAPASPAMQALIAETVAAEIPAAPAPAAAGL